MVFPEDPRLHCALYFIIRDKINALINALSLNIKKNKYRRTLNPSAPDA